MVMLDYDLSAENGDMGFEVLPVGAYEAHIIKSEMLFSKLNSDKYLQMTWQILSGNYKGRLLFDRAMLEGKGRQFGFNRLKAIALAVGHRNPNQIGDSSTLHGISCEIKVAQRAWNEEMQNEIKDYKKSLKSWPDATPQTKSTTPPPPPGKQKKTEPAEEYPIENTTEDDLPF